MKQLALFVSLVLGITYSVNAQQVKRLQTNYFNTADQMLLANEMNESGEPFAEFLGYNLNNLNPFVRNQPDSIAYTLGIENYEYSRYFLGTVNSRSGIGMNLMWGLLLVKWLLWSRKVLMAPLPEPLMATMKMMSLRKTLCILV